MPPDHLRIHHCIPASLTNGPGMRYVIWVQGCTLACPGCFNPETHPADAGETLDIQSLSEEILSHQAGLEGVTISGGEPFQQAAALKALLAEIKQRSRLSVLIFSGYRRAELAKIPFASDVLAMTDVLIAGRFVQRKRMARGLVGSSNKEVLYLTDRYQPHDLAGIFESEVLIETDGSIRITGIDPLKWHK